MSDDRPSAPRAEDVPVLGEPDEQPAPEGDRDYAGEHDDTAVSDRIASGTDDDERESESPTGLGGMDMSGPV